MTVLVIVALLAEGVDRNQYGWFERLFQYGVALLAEGVDRNIEVPRGCCVTVVALLAEGVDRNANTRLYMGGAARRPPRGGRG